MERAHLVARVGALAAHDDLAEAVVEADLPELASLTQRALRGTVDDHGRDDADRLAQLEAYWGGHPGPRIPSAELLRRHHGAAVSFVLTSFLWDTPVITYLMTDPRFQGRGHGTALLRGAGQALATEGYDEVALRVTVANPAYGFYLRLGFEPRAFPASS